MRIIKSLPLTGYFWVCTEGLVIYTMNSGYPQGMRCGAGQGSDIYIFNTELLTFLIV